MDYLELNLEKLDNNELIRTNAGASFAYRAGQLIRFIGLGGGLYAYMDFVVNETVNQR